MEKLPDFDFPHWLKCVENVYRTLTAQQKTITFNHLLEICEPSQLYLLQQRLQNSTSRDFIRFLPAELVECVLGFLGPKVVCGLCLVSKSWRDVIGHCNGFWREACENLGVAKSSIDQQKSKDESYKILYLKMVCWVNKFSAGHYFEEMTLSGSDQRVMATFYKDGILATGGDDRTVRFWNCDTGQCTAIIPTTHSTCDLKFSDKYLVTASFDATASCWDRMSTPVGRVVAKYIGHTSGVTCVDFNEDLNITVTGSADESIKVWSFREACLLCTLSGDRPHAIRKIYLQHSCQNDDIIISSRTDGNCFQWTLSSDMVPNEADSLSGKNSFRLIHFPFYAVKEMLVFVVQCKHTRTPSQVPLNGQDNLILGTGFVSKDNDIYVMNTSVLGIGERFHIQYSNFSPNIGMSVINNRTGNPLCAVLDQSPTIRTTNFGHNVFVGANSWLNGFPDPSEIPWGGVVMGAAMCDNSVRVIKWKKKVKNT